MGTTRKRSAHPRCFVCNRLAYFGGDTYDGRRLCAECGINPPPEIVAQREKVAAIMRRSTRKFSKRSI